MLARPNKRGVTMTVLMRIPPFLVKVHNSISCNFKSANKSKVCSILNSKNFIVKPTCHVRYFCEEIPNQPPPATRKSHQRLPNEDELVQFIDIKNEKSRMTFRELKNMALESMETKNRDLYRVVLGGTDKSAIKTFKLLLPDELGLALYKNRLHKKNHHYTKVNLSESEVSLSTVREKQFIVRSGISDNDLEISCKKIRQCLDKDFVVRIIIESNKDKSGATNLENKIKEKVLTRPTDSFSSKIKFLKR